MRRLIRFLFQLLVLAMLVFALTAVWILFDGLTDLGEKADVGLVFDHSGAPGGELSEVTKARLDRTVQLYKDSVFPFIIVSGGRDANEAPQMRHYLEMRGISPATIIEDDKGFNLSETAHHAAAIMKGREMHSVMIVTVYYEMTRAKLALSQADIVALDKTHVGTLRKEDAMAIAGEVCALYQNLYEVYGRPLMGKIEKEANVGWDKAKDLGQDVKKTIDSKIDSLAK